MKRMSDNKEPKVIPSFDGCYNYDRLKKEGLVNEEEKKGPTSVTNNALFVGSTADLAKLIKGETSKKQ